MNSLGRTLTVQTSRRWWISFPYLLALITVFYIGWATWQAVHYPYDGVRSFHPTGLVSEIDPEYPPENTLYLGDTILTVDGVPFRDAVPLYAGKQLGMPVNFNVLRNHENVSVQITPTQPPITEVAVRIAPLLVAIIFLAIGVGVQAFKPVYEGTYLFFLFFLGSAILLTTGTISSIGPRWTPALFSMLIWIIGPLAVHFHFYFPQVTNLFARRPFLIISYAIGLFGGLPYLLLGISALRSSPWYNQIVAASRLYVAINLLLVVALLIYAYRYALSPACAVKSASSS